MRLENTPTNTDTRAGTAGSLALITGPPPLPRPPLASTDAPPPAARLLLAPWWRLLSAAPIWLLSIMGRGVLLACNVVEDVGMGPPAILIACVCGPVEGTPVTPDGDSSLQCATSGLVLWFPHSHVAGVGDIPGICGMGSGASTGACAGACAGASDGA